MWPTPLGIALIDALEAAEPSLVHSELRARMEAEVTRIAEGKCQKQHVVDASLDTFKGKYIEVHQRMHLIAPLFLSAEALEVLNREVARSTIPLAVAGGKLKNVSDRQLRKLDEAEETLAIVADQAERHRREQERLERKQAVDASLNALAKAGSKEAVAAQIIHNLFA